MLGRILKITIAILAVNIAAAQEMIGVVTGNFAGSNGIFINPSSIANTPLKADVNLLTIHAFEENNYFYLPANETSFFELVRGSYRFPYHPKPYGEGERNVYAYYSDTSPKNIDIKARVVGPSFMVSVKDHVFGMHMGMRTVSSTSNLPYDIANFCYYGLDFYPQHNIFYDRGDYHMATLAMWEVGATYATVVKRNINHHFAVGATVNLLFGYSGSYLEGYKTQYIAYNDSILNVALLDAELGLALPTDYTSNEIMPWDELVRGSGIGIDLGFTYQHRGRPYEPKSDNKHYDKRFETYDYKIGVSLLDLGSVRFRKNAIRHAYENVSNNHINVNDLVYDNLQTELEDLSEIFYNDRDASYRDDNFSIFLPAAISVQADYRFRGPWFVNGTFVTSLPINSPMVRRPSILAITPRYETRMLAIQLPVLLYDYNRIRVGLSVRIWDLTVGSDKLGTFISNRNFTGMDLYASYKINILYRDKSYRNRKDPCQTF